MYISPVFSCWVITMKAKSTCQCKVKGDVDSGYMCIRFIDCLFVTNGV